MTAVVEHAIMEVQPTGMLEAGQSEGDGSDRLSSFTVPDTSLPAACAIAASRPCADADAELPPTCSGMAIPAIPPDAPLSIPARCSDTHSAPALCQIPWKRRTASMSAVRRRRTIMGGDLAGRGRRESGLDRAIDAAAMQ